MADASDDQTEKRPLTAYERWELPVMNENQAPRESAVSVSRKPSQQTEAAARGPEEPVRPPTAAELEGIRQAAREEGLAEGQEEGRRQGHQEGFSQGQKQGLEQGRQDGLKQGRDEAFAEHQQAILENMGRLQSLMTSLLEPIRNEQRDIENALLNLVSGLAEKVVGRELSTPDEHLLDLVERAVAALPDADTRVRVRLNPDDLRFIRQYADKWPDTWQLLESDAIEPGGCEVETSQSLVDFSRSQRFRDQLQLLFEPVDEDQDLEEAGDE